MYEHKKQLTSLPFEIKEYILINLDGISLSRMRSVSKEWKDILDNPTLRILKKWKQICLTEMDDVSLRNVLNKLQPKYFICSMLDDNLWYTAYKSWHQWPSLLHWSFTKSELYSNTDCEITCIANSGDWIIVSTRNYGSLVGINYLTMDITSLFAGGNILNIYPYSVGSDEPLFVGLAHDYVTLIFDNLTRGELDLHSLDIHYHEEYSGRRQSFNFEDKSVTVRALSHIVIKISTVGKQHVQELEVPLIKSVEHCWKNWNLLVNSEGRYVVLDDNCNSISKHPFNMKDLIHRNENPIKYYFGNEVIISVNRRQYCNHEMIIVVRGDKQHYRPFVDISKHITSVVYYGMMLFLGTDVGTVNIYRTKHILDLLQLNLIDPYIVFDFGNNPIISIAIKETSMMPIFWAASNSQVFQIKFY